MRITKYMYILGWPAQLCATYTLEVLSSYPELHIHEIISKKLTRVNNGVEINTRMD